MKVFQLIDKLTVANPQADVVFVGKNWKETPITDEDFELVCQGGQERKPVLIIFTPEGRKP